MLEKKNNLAIGFVSVGATILICILSTVLIKNLGNILYLFGQNKLGGIFSQLEDSKEISVPFTIPLIVFGVTTFLMFFKGFKLLPLKIVILILLFILVLFISILLTTVHGLYFVDVLISLIENIGGLGL